MSNIFGKQAQSYNHLAKLSTKGLLDSHLEAAKAQGKPYLFDSQLGMYAGKQLTDSSESAAGFGWLTNNLQAIQAEIEEVLYLNYRLSGLVPINTAIPEGLESYAYRVKNSSFGKNAGSSSTSYNLVATPVLQGGIDAMWSLQDVRQAIFAGVPLQADTIEDATVACLNHIETVGLLGDSSKGFTGLVNNSDVADAAVQINGYLNTLLEQTSTIFAQRMVTGLTIYLPVKQFNFLATTKYNVDATKTLMDYLKTSNAWTANTGMPIEFKTVIELKGAGIGSTDRMLIAFNNQKVMEIGNPIMPRVIGINNELRFFRAPLEYSLSQLNVKYPDACLYIDSI
jgi:hypothetical protein